MRFPCIASNTSLTRRTTSNQEVALEILGHVLSGLLGCKKDGVGMAAFALSYAHRDREGDLQFAE